MNVIVIGAGIGGLACAARLAAAGHHVTVLERASTVGGKLATYERQTDAGTFRFDTGPSLLTLPQVFADLFAATGSNLHDELELVRLEPVLRHIFADGSVLDSTADPSEFARRVDAVMGSNAAAQWVRLWRRSGRIWQASWRDILNSPVDNPWAIARLAWRLRDLIAIAPGRTLRDLSRSMLDDPRLRMLLDRYATYTGSDPRRAPAALAAIPYAELRYGGWYVRGGLATLATALRRRCEALGVDVRTEHQVVRIQTQLGSVSGVELAGGERLRAHVVVANADAAMVYRDLLPTPRRALRLREHSLGGFVLLLGVRGRTPGLSHHTVFFPADYDGEFNAIFGMPAHPVDDPTIVVTVADDPAVRPEGFEAWFVLVNAAPHGHSPSTVDWRQPGLAEAYADQILSRLAERGVDVRDRLLFREIRTPADLEATTGAPGGAIYGTPSHGLLRPSNRGPVRGLYLVGGSTHPGGGLPMVALSARIVADLIGKASQRRTDGGQ